MSEVVVPVKEREQVDTMVTGVWRDQHGRQWAGMTDKESQAPISLRPFGWTPPLPAMTPPAKYHTYHVASRSFTIEYKGWLDEYAEAQREYQTWEMQVARHHFGAAALEKIKAGDAELRRLAGEPPQDVQFIKAMAAGNKWALGLTRPDGTAYPRPSWADDAFHSWQIESVTRADEESLGDASLFWDVDDEPVTADARPEWLGETDIFADDDAGAVPAGAVAGTRRGRKGGA
jgi:hypothetical protein